MSVNLRGRDVAVAEHLLHGAQIGAALEQMRGEAMPQGMRADPSEARLAAGPSFERLEKPLPGHRAAEPRDENRGYATRDFFFAALSVAGPVEDLVAPLEVSLKRANRGATHRHHPLLAALAEHDDRAGREIHLVHLQADQLRNAQPASVSHFEHRAIAHSARVARVDRGDEIF